MKIFKFISPATKMFRLLNRRSGSGALLMVSALSSAAAFMTASSGVLTTQVQKNGWRKLSYERAESRSRAGAEAVYDLANNGTLAYNGHTGSWTGTLPSGLYDTTTSGGSIQTVTFKQCDPATLSATDLSNVFVNKTLPNNSTCDSTDFPVVKLNSFTQGNFALNRPGVLKVGTNTTVIPVGPDRALASSKYPRSALAANIDVNIQPPTCTLTTTRTNLLVSTAMTLTLSVSGLVQGSAIDAPASATFGTTGGSTSYSPAVEGVGQSVTGRVWGPGGETTCQVFFNVYTRPACTISASPTSIVHHNTTTLTLNSTPSSGIGLLSASISRGGASSAVTTTVGTWVDTPPIGTITYTGTVYGAGALNLSASCTVNVIVVPPSPTCQLDIFPSYTVHTGMQINVLASDLSGSSFPITSGRWTWNSDANPPMTNEAVPMPLPTSRMTEPNGPPPPAPGAGYDPWWFGVTMNVANAEGGTSSCAASKPIYPCFIWCDSNPIHGANVVTELYHDVLGREPDLGGLGGWLVGMDGYFTSAGWMHILDVENAFRNSPEYTTYIHDYLGESIINMYRTIVGRFPSSGEVNFWWARMTFQPWLYGMYQLRDALMASPEYTGALHGEPIVDLYRRLLGRTPSDGEIAWQADYQVGTNFTGGNPAQTILFWIQFENGFRGSNEYQNLRGGARGEIANSQYRLNLCRFAGNDEALWWSNTTAADETSCPAWLNQALRAVNEYTDNGGCPLPWPPACPVVCRGGCGTPGCAPCPTCTGCGQPGCPACMETCNIFVHYHGDNPEWTVGYVPENPRLYNGALDNVTEGRRPTSGSVLVWRLDDPMVKNGNNYPTRGGKGTAECTRFNSEHYSPLVIDVHDEGISVFPPTPGVWFDLLGEGNRKPWAWIANPLNSMWLVYDAMDKFENFDINNLFGNNTRGPDGEKAANGFDALAKYDLDNDHFITQKDAIWPHLRLWADLNRDGLVQKYEIMTLESKKIKDIDLLYLNITERNDVYGDETRQRSVVDLDVNGPPSARLRKIYDLWLVTDGIPDANTKASDPSKK